MNDQTQKAETVATPPPLPLQTAATSRQQMQKSKLSRTTTIGSLSHRLQMGNGGPYRDSHVRLWGSLLAPLWSENGLHQAKPAWPRLSKGIGVILIVLLLSACAEKRDWQEAESKNTFWAYEEFLERHLHGTRADEARKKRYEFLINERLPAFKKVRTAKANITVVNDGAEKHISSILKEIVTSFLRYADVETVQGADYDMILELNIVAKPMGAYYYPGPVYLYTGASVKGTVRLKAPGGHEISDKFQGIVEVAPFAYNRPVSPEYAPYDWAWYDAGLERKIWLLIAKGLGFYPLVLAVKNSSIIMTGRGDPGFLTGRGVRGFSAGDALAEIKDGRTVEPLIRALLDRNMVVRESAEEALMGITGQRFGENEKVKTYANHEQWDKWWKEEGRRQFNR